jgi:outer membrane protein insertion porin family
MRICSHRRAPLSLIGLFLCSFALASLAPAGQSGSAQIKEVLATGSSRFSSNAIVQALGLKVGDTVTRDDMQRAADALAQLGPFLSVQYRYTSVEQGVKIEYQVKDAPGLPVWFDNFPWFTDDELIAELKKSNPLFDGTLPQGGTLLSQVAQSLEKFLEQHGIFGSVSYDMTAIGTDSHQVIEFKLEGAGAQIEHVQFSDPLAQNDRAILDRLSDVVGKPYSRSELESFDLEQVRPEYLAHGFLNVKFPEAKPVFPPGAEKSSATKVDVLLTIDPGVPYSWGAVTWMGSTAIPTAQLDALVDLKPGEVADGMLIEALWQKVRSAYERMGYLDMALQPSAQFDDAAKKVSYSAAIQEGPQYHMGQLVLTGLSVEGERRIRGAWSIAPGAVFNESIYQDFLDNGIKRAFYGFPAHYEKIGRFLQKDPKAGKVDVLIDFQ